jgi:glycosyltransferase 2 family protein
MAMRVVVTVTAAWLVFRAIDWTSVLNLVAGADIALLSFALLVALLQFAFLVFRWHAIIEILSGISASYAQLGIGLGRSMLLSQIMPSTVGGDVVRVVAVAGHTGMGSAARSVICDRILGLAVLAAMVVVMLPFFASHVGVSASFIVVAGVSIAGMVIFLLLLVSPPKLSRFPWVGGYVAIVGGDVRRMLISGPISILVLVMILVTHLLSVVIVYDLARGFAASISFVQCLVVVPPALLISATPVSLGGWGVREGALVAGFALVGASTEAAVAASVFFGLTGPLVGMFTELTFLVVRTQKGARKNG